MEEIIVIPSIKAKLVEPLLITLDIELSDLQDDSNVLTMEEMQEKVTRIISYRRFIESVNNIDL